MSEEVVVVGVDPAVGVKTVTVGYPAEKGALLVAARMAAVAGSKTAGSSQHSHNSPVENQRSSGLKKNGRSRHYNE